LLPAGAEVFRALAAGGVGLIVTGFIAVSPGGRINDFGAMADDDRQVENLRLIVQAVRRADPDCKVVAQLAHVGPNARVVEPVAASSKPWRSGLAAPRALTTGDVEQITRLFARAAARAKEAGFDGVQLHAAHGYLLSTFLSPYTNIRTDKYGGSFAHRARIIREIVARTRRLAGNRFPILVKMNCDDQVEGGLNLDTFPAAAREVVKAGAQVLEVSGANPCRTNLSDPAQHSYFLKYAQALPARVPVILTGGNRSIDRLEKLCRAGGADFFGLSRPLLREPDLPRRWLEGRGGEDAACPSCSQCIQALSAGDRAVTRCRLEG
jgi:2,4-dienoyl-CoA reductase-like NADH-dependent reductase (Old Yellow Enzyme family)